MSRHNIGFADVEVDPSTLDDDALALAVRRCGRLKGRVNAAQGRLVAEITRRKSAAEAEATLRREQGVGARDAKDATKLANTLDRHPDVAEAVGNGEITPTHARAIGDAADEHPGAVGELLPKARSQGADAFGRTARGWRQRRAADNGEAEADRQRKARKASMWIRQEDGMGILHAELDPVSYAKLRAALGAWNERRWRAEHGDASAGPTLEMTTPQRLHDALIDALDASLTGTAGPNNAQVVVIADFDAVSGMLVNGRLSDGTPLPATTVRRLACEADIVPMMFSGAGIPLWAGRSRRLPTRTQRLAVIARDGGCVGDSCSVPPEWCDVHHVKYWERFGPTDIDNLCLLCSNCHHAVHAGTLVVIEEAGRFRAVPRRRAKRSDPPDEHDDCSRDSGYGEESDRVATPSDDPHRDRPLFDQRTPESRRATATRTAAMGWTR